MAGLQRPEQQDGANDVHWALYNACADGIIEAIRDAVDRGADPAFSDYFLWTALHWVASNGQCDAFMLVRHNAKTLTPKDKYGKTPRDAAKGGMKTMLYLCEDWPADDPRWDTLSSSAQYKLNSAARKWMTGRIARVDVHAGTIVFYIAGKTSPTVQIALKSVVRCNVVAADSELLPGKMEGDIDAVVGDAKLPREALPNGAPSTPAPLPNGDAENGHVSAVRAPGKEQLAQKEMARHRERSALRVQVLEEELEDLEVARRKLDAQLQKADKDDARLESAEVELEAEVARFMDAVKERRLALACEKATIAERRRLVHEQRGDIDTQARLIHDTLSSLRDEV